MGNTNCLSRGSRGTFQFRIRAERHYRPVHGARPLPPLHLAGCFCHAPSTAPTYLCIQAGLYSRIKLKGGEILRIGNGYDVHRLQQGRRLVLGGVEIEYPLGLQGHSDADVLLHAICDALLGAAGMGDIGRHFPDSDERYRDISSLYLLEEVGHKLNQAGFTVINIDSTIIAQKPRLAPYIETMVQNIARVLHIEKGQVNVKATTTEGLGFEGREEGISALAVALIE